MSQYGKPDPSLNQVSRAHFLHLYALLKHQQQTASDPDVEELLQRMRPIRNQLAHLQHQEEITQEKLDTSVAELLDFLRLVERSSLGTARAKANRLLAKIPEITSVIQQSKDELALTGLRPSAPPPVGEDGDEELEGVLTATISGDRSAMSWLLGWIRPIVVRYCRTRIGRGTDSYAEADEVAQEVCLAVLTSLPAYRSQGRPFLAFLYGIAAHKVADRNRGDAEGQDVAGGSPDLGDEVGGLSENLSTLLGILPPRQREVLILRVVVGMSATDAAAALEMTEKAVRAAQHRALTKLQKAAQAEEIISS